MTALQQTISAPPLVPRMPGSASAWTRPDDRGEVHGDLTGSGWTIDVWPTARAGFDARSFYTTGFSSTLDPSIGSQRVGPRRGGVTTIPPPKTRFVSSRRVDLGGMTTTGEFERLVATLASLMNNGKLSRGDLVHLVHLVKLVEERHAAAPMAAGPTPLQERIERLAERANLTREELADLVGVSRRALQKWVAGEPISAAKDRHLREVEGILTSLPPHWTSNVIRDRLFGRPAPDRIRPVDLMREGSFDSARTALIEGGPPSDARPMTAPKPELDLDVRLAGEDGGHVQPAGLVSTRYRGRRAR